MAVRCNQNNAFEIMHINCKIINFLIIYIDCNIALAVIAHCTPLTMLWECISAIGFQSNSFALHLCR